MKAFLSIAEEHGRNVLPVLMVRKRDCWLRVLGGVIFSCAILLFFTTEGAADDRIVKTNGVNGSTKALREPDSGRTQYVSNDFTGQGDWATGGSAVVDISEGLVDLSFPQVNGEVYASVADGKGGFFIGGAFDSVGGKPRRNAAHIAADGMVDSWAPELNGSVRAMALLGSTIYMGGGFTKLGSVDRNFVAAVDINGAIDQMWKPEANNKVYALVVVGSNVYLGGDFTEVQGETRNRLAAVSINGELDTEWAPNANDSVFTISGAAGEALIYFGGNFTQVDNAARNHAAAVGVDGTLNSWDPNVNGPVFCLVVDPNVKGDVVIGGSFTLVAGVPRNNLAIWSSSNGISSFDPNPNGPVRTGAFYNIANEGLVYVGGEFTKMGDSNRSYAAAIYYGGSVAPWRPEADGPVLSLSIENKETQKIYLGGTFMTVGGNGSLKSESRPRLAAIDDTPTELPTSTPTVVPTETPTSTPTDTPTEIPTSDPTETPTSTPTVIPTETPVSTPTVIPTETPAATSTPIPTLTAIPTPLPQVRLAKPVVNWSPDAASRRVRAFVSRVRGVSYSISATLKGKERKGQCALDKRSRKILCNIRLTRGSWLVSITPSKQGVKGRPTQRRVTFRR
jgi:hypothetical protein